MFEYIIIGGGMAFAAAIQPGPLQAFLLSSVAQRGWKRTLPAAFAPLFSDGPIVLLTIFVLSYIPPAFSLVLRAAGGGFLIYLAWLTYRQWQRLARQASEANPSVQRTLFQAVMVNLLNPNPYLSWSLVLGPALMKAWQQSPVNAIALVIAFYATMVTTLAGTVLLFGTTRFLGTGMQRWLILISAILLALLGLYQFIIVVLSIFD